MGTDHEVGEAGEDGEWLAAGRPAEGAGEGGRVRVAGFGVLAGAIRLTGELRLALAGVFFAGREVAGGCDGGGGLAAGRAFGRAREGGEGFGLAGFAWLATGGLGGATGGSARAAGGAAGLRAGGRTRLVLRLEAGEVLVRGFMRRSDGADGILDGADHRNAGVTGATQIPGFPLR